VGEGGERLWEGNGGREEGGRCSGVGNEEALLRVSL